MQDSYKGFTLLLTNIEKNSALPDYVKLKNTERLADIARTNATQAVYSQLFDRNKYIQTVKSRVSKAVGDKVTSITDSMGDITDALSMMNDGGKGAGLSALGGIAAGMGADVTVLDRNMSVLRRLDLQHQGRIKTVFSNQMNLEKAIRNAHLVIGAVLIRGSATPKLITHQLVQEMKDGSVIVDVSIDQGGCCETSLPTTYQNPTYTLDGVVHYCVTNMPGAVAKTSTIALTNATLPFILEVANKGWQRAAKENRHLINGINVCSGNVTSYPVARDLGYTYIDPETLI
jgi:alanine dehydrogenase